MGIKINHNIKMRMSNKRGILLPVILVTLAVISSVFVVYAFSEKVDESILPNPVGLSLNASSPSYKENIKWKG